MLTEHRKAIGALSTDVKAAPSARLLKAVGAYVLTSDLGADKVFSQAKVGPGRLCSGGR